jgi:NTP pyrophosphatase (non-canonical NTP hydrolase)
MPEQSLLDLGKAQAHLREFAEQRDWKKFHSPKNLSMALAGEAGELLEIFQWLTEDDSHAAAHEPERRNAVAEELADILQYVLRIADLLGIDINQALWDKLAKNAEKYPVDRSRGNARKYTEFSG